MSVVLFLGPEIGEGTAEERAAAVGRVYARVYLRLSPLVGSAGVRALFERSAAQILGKHPFLATISKPAGEPAGRGQDPADLLRTCLQDQAPAVVTESAVALFETFFALLATFIGERLSKQVMESAGPAGGKSSVSERKE